MKRLLAIFLSLFLLLSLTACGIKGEEVVFKTLSDENRVDIELDDPSAIPKPDKILYYHNGKETILESGTEAFETVFSMNQSRCPETLHQYKCSIFDWNDCFKQTDILEYWYDSQYYPVIFNLKIVEKNPQGEPHEYTYYWATCPRQLLYGDLSEASDLLAYLNSLK